MPNKRKLNIFQKEALKETKRFEKKNKRGIIVIPSGTGKTFIAVEWFKKKLKKNPNSKLLFICHNQDILSQAHKKEFLKYVKHEHIKYGYYNAYLKDNTQVIFATVQTLNNNLTNFPKDYFDYIIIDECHHYQARTYKQTILHFEPKFMLGLTATPERMDRKNITKILGNIIYRKTFFEGIKNDLLTPVEYYCVENDFDFDGIEHNGYQYKEKQLNRRFCVEEYDQAIVKEYKETLKNYPNKKQGIGFCLTVAHARRLAEVFRKKGINAQYLAGYEFTYGSKKIRNKRKEVIEKYEKGEIQILFVCNLFNEGIDIPETDFILMFRPTHSATIYMQQIGRGLRKKEGKENVLILDFTGNSKITIGFKISMKNLFGIDLEEEIEYINSLKRGKPLSSHLIKYFSSIYFINVYIPIYL